MYDLMVLLAVTEQFLALPFFFFFPSVNNPDLICFVASFFFRVQEIPCVGEVGLWGEKGFLVKRFSSMGIYSHHLSFRLPSCL